ncbi:MAG: hypothetical protein ACOCYO_03140 [Bacteroidota bacterium]
MKSTCLFSFLISIFFIFNQIIDLKGQSVDYIRTSGEYYFGIGNGKNYQQARRTALELLSESISVQIQSEFKQVVEETGEDVNIYTQSVVNTYSTSVINRYDDKLIKEEPGDVDVMVYVLKSEMQAAFRQRVQMIEDFILLAVKATDQLRIADALRYYYWGLVLARSHPDNTKLRSTFGGDIELPLMLELTDRINNIFSQLSVEVSRIDETEKPSGRNLYLNITYDGSPVQDLDYYYFVGDGYSGLYSANNGKGFAEFYGPTSKDLNRLRMRIEYQYHNKADLAPEVKLMLENVEIPYFKRAEFIIDLDEKKLPSPSTKPVTTQLNQEPESTYSVGEYNFYEHTVRKISNAIETSDHESLVGLFTPRGYSMYEKLIANGQVKVLGLSNDSLKMIKVGNEIMVRSVPMLFSFDNNSEKFIENVVFTFDEQKKVNGIAYSLTDIAIDDILSKPESFGSEEEKYFLIKFMEDFKTAYSLKRLDYLDAIFDENALIIVGNVVKRSQDPVENVQSMYGNLSDEEIEYIRLSKKDYIDRLQMIFRRNEFINIRFEDNKVKKTQKDDKIYGIQINQYYYSSTYADKGYLFLMIDLNDTLNPKVYVRTWQPKKNPDGSIYGLGDFRF